MKRKLFCVLALILCAMLLASCIPSESDDNESSAQALPGNRQTEPPAPQETKPEESTEPGEPAGPDNTGFELPPDIF